MLQLIFNGTIGKDAEIREYNGNKFLSFSVAHTQRWKDKEGQKQEKTEWIECTMSSVSLAMYLLKGTKVLVQGTPESRAYTTKDNTAKGVLACRVSRLDFLGSSATSEKQTPMTENVTAQIVTNDQPTDDLPF